MSTASLTYSRNGISDWTDDDDDRPGRVLNAQEFAEALALRSDIFSSDRDRHPLLYEFAFVLSAAGLGIVLNRMEAAMIIGPDFPGALPPGSIPSVSAKVITEPISPPGKVMQTTVNRPPDSDRRTMSRPSTATSHRSSGGTGGGDIRERIAMQGVLGLTSGLVAGKISEGDPMGKSGYAQRIDAILSGEMGLRQGGGGVGRKGARGIGYGPGNGSGFDGSGDGLNGLIDGLLTAAIPQVSLTRKGGNLNLGVTTDPTIIGTLGGGRTKSSIWRTVQQLMGGLRYAYNKRLRENPGLGGKIAVKFAIDEYGNVLSCTVTDSKINDLAFNEQVVNIIKRWKFDKIDRPGDVTEVMYPFVFSM